MHRFPVILSTCVLAFAGSVQAHDAKPGGSLDGVKANEGHVADSAGNVVRDGAGQCLLTPAYVKDKHGIVECGEIAAPTPEPAAVAAKPKPAPVSKIVEERVSLSADVLFDFDKATLKPAGQASIAALARDWKSQTDARQITAIRVVGHADSRGPDQYNQSLSERRAKTVRDEMVAQGIAAALITASGRGESVPVASNDTDAGRARNRRVDIVVEGIVRTRE